jgi:hypothetical protein
MPLLFATRDGTESRAPTAAANDNTVRPFQ